MDEQQKITKPKVTKPLRASPTKKPKAPKKPETKVFIAKKPVKKPFKKPASKASKKAVAKKREQKQIKLGTLTPKTLFNNFNIIKTAIRESDIDRTEIRSDFKTLEKLLETRNDTEKTEVTNNIIEFLNTHTDQPAILNVINALNETRALTKTKIELLQGTKDKFDSVVAKLTKQEYVLSDGQLVKTQNDALLYLIEQFKAQQSAT